MLVIYINDLHTAIKFGKVHHFADDANLPRISNSIKKLNKFVIFDLKSSSNWFNAKNISLSVSKNELKMFKRRMKKIDFDLKWKPNGKKLYSTTSVKYLGIKMKWGP